MGILFIVAVLLLVFVGFYYIVYVLHKKVLKAQKLLKENNYRLKLALSAGGIIVWGFDVKNMKYYNVDCSIFPPEGRMFDDEVRMFHPDDQQPYRHMILNACKGILPVSTFCFRIDYTQTGNWKYIEKHITLIKDSNGKVTNIIGTHKDLTEEKKREQEVKILNGKVREYAERISYVLRKSHTITWFFDIKKDLITIYNEDDQLYNTLSSADYISLCEPNVREEVCRNYALAQVNQLDSLSVQRKISFNKENKEEQYYAINGIPIKNKEGVVTSFFGICNDITTLMQTQHKLENEMLKVMKADKLKSQFLANMSHEIRTPLNSIVGFSNVLETAMDPEERAQCVKLINSNSELLLTIINDILDYSKLEVDLIEFNVKRFNLSDLFNITYKSLEHLTADTNIQFVCEVPYPQCYITADYNRLQQVLTNFITNAIKYTDKGSVTMSYQCDDNSVKLMVKDTGQGIPEDKINLVFERFEKLNSFKQGTGLGLAICKVIVEKCGGEIGVDSTLSVGSTFWAKLPFQPEIVN